jgi:hypothetical protein
MSKIERGVEAQIRKAMAEGKFDNLPGKGQPLNLDAYFQTPEDVRMAYAILKDAKLVPEEAHLLKEIAALRDELKSSSNENKKKRLTKALNEKSLMFAIMMERNRRAKRTG